MFNIVSNNYEDTNTKGGLMVAKQLKDEFIGIRVTGVMKQRIEKMAKENELNISKYVIYLIEKELSQK